MFATRHTPRLPRSIRGLIGLRGRPCVRPTVLPCVLLVLGLGAIVGPRPAWGQPAPADGLRAPKIVSVIPNQVTAGAEIVRAHLHLQGSFPQSSYKLLSRLAVFVSGNAHSCRLGWGQEPIDALIGTSGQPWLTQGDLLTEGDNRERRLCGTIDGLWDDRLEISLAHPRLLKPGVLRIGVALYPASTDKPLSEDDDAIPQESWIEVLVTKPFRVVGWTPQAPVSRAGESLRLSFAITGDAPTRVTLERGDESVAIPFEVEGDRVGVLIAPQLYEAPVTLRLRLHTGREEAQVSVPVCVGGARTGVTCPAR